MLIADTQAPCRPELPERPLRFDEGLLDVLPVAVCTLDADGRVLRYNRLADQLCGGSLAVRGRLCLLHPTGPRCQWPSRPWRTPCAPGVPPGTSGSGSK